MRRSFIRPTEFWPKLVNALFWQFLMVCLLLLFKAVLDWRHFLYDLKYHLSVRLVFGGGVGLVIGVLGGLAGFLGKGSLVEHREDADVHNRTRWRIKRPTAAEVAVMLFLLLTVPCFALTHCAPGNSSVSFTRAISMALTDCFTLWALIVVGFLAYVSIGAILLYLRRQPRP